MNSIARLLSLIAFSLAMSADHSPVAAEDEQAHLTLELTTKLGVRAKVIVDGSSIGEDYNGYEDGLISFAGGASHNEKAHRLSLDLGDGVHILVPWHLIDSVIANEKQHKVMLKDGKSHVGTILTTITTSDGRKYALAAAKEITPTGAPKVLKPRVTYGVQHIAMPVMLTLGDVKPLVTAATFSAFYSVARGGDAFKVTHTPEVHGASFQVTVDDEKLDGNLPEFDRFVLKPVPEKREWAATLQAKGGPEIQGSFVNPSDDSYSSWAMRFVTADDCVLMIVRPGKTITIVAAPTINSKK